MVRSIVFGSLVAVGVACPLVACTANGGTGSGAGNSGTEGGARSPDALTVAAAGDLSISQSLFAPAEVTPSLGTGQAPGSGLTSIVCHPELFARSVEYSEVLNYHLNMFLKDVDSLLKEGGTLNGKESTWTFYGRDADMQLVLLEVGPGVFDVMLGIAAAGGTDYVTVVNGVVNRSSPDDISKQLTFDLDALHQVFPPASGDQSSGQLGIDVERVKNSDGSDKTRIVSYTLTDFVPVYGDPQGPRTGAIDLIDVPTVGGAMLYDVSTALLCPPNPQHLSADARTYARWIVRGDTVSGRADAIATGGQMTSGDRWVGLSCRSNPTGILAGAALVTDNGYWLIKEEDSTGATVVGAEISMVDPSSTDAPCNPVFGAVTDLTDDTNDPALPTSVLPSALTTQF
jgi:hypothetical protein